MLLVEFIYNNAKNASIGYTSFGLNYKYYFWILYKENIDSCFKSKSIDKLLAELRKLIIIYRENLYYTQET